VAVGVSLLEKNGQVLKHCDEVNRLEDVADYISRKAIWAPRRMQKIGASRRSKTISGPMPSCAE
jgi:hypothetical protein